MAKKSQKHPIVRFPSLVPRTVSSAGIGSVTSSPAQIDSSKSTPTQPPYAAAF